MNDNNGHAQLEDQVEFNPNGVPITSEEYGTSVMLRALQSFQYIEENEYLGTADGLSMQEESMKCQCQYNEGDDPDDACGEHCINRMLFVECSPKDCPVGEKCLNRRMQKKEYASIEIFQTAKKGFGMRSKEKLKKNQFVIEYMGEVVTSAMFRKRTKQYEQMGEKHFYFMSLKTDQVIDATKKGGIARFINHSCDPNCVLQKWIVGKHLRMGIFTKREIDEGEELTFDYKFERYGAPCQVCLCGSVKCKGTIGIQKSIQSVEGEIGEDSENESEDDSKTKGNNNKNLIKGLETPDQVTEFCKSFVQSSSQVKRVNKLLDKLLATSMSTSLRKFVQLHGIILLKFCLKPHLENPSICRKILTILNKLPVTTKNTINDSKIIEIIHSQVNHKDPIISTLSQKLDSDWSKLETVYRIPKAPKPQKPVALKNEKSDEQKRLRADSDASNDSKRLKKAYFKGNRWSSSTPPVEEKQPELFSAPSEPLPEHWSFAHDSDGKIYYYNTETLVTQWEHPSTDSHTRKYVSNEVPKDILNKIAEAAHKAVEDRHQLEREKRKKQKVREREKEEKSRVKAKEKDEKSKVKEKEKDEKSKVKEKVKDEKSKEKEKEEKSKEKELINDEKKRSLRDEISVVVIKYLSRFRDEMSPEAFKKHARKITHILIEKAAKNKDEEMNDEMRRKVKKFVETYVEEKKVC